MKYWVVLWIKYRLPGGLFGKFIPKHLRPFLGEAQPQWKKFSKKELACAHVRRVGQFANPRLFWCENLRGWERDVDFETVVQIEGEK